LPTCQCRVIFERIGYPKMPLLNASGVPSHTNIALQTRLQTDIDNIQPWHYSSFEWRQLDSENEKYKRLGAEIVSEVCPVYNCHGLTFASRRTQVGEVGLVTIEKILADDGYTEVHEPNARFGDVVVYYDQNGLAQHSGFMVGRGDYSVPRIWSKWGKGYEWVHPLGVCMWGGMKTRFFRITLWKY
jgi:hypothetical protein